MIGPPDPVPDGFEGQQQVVRVLLAGAAEFPAHVREDSLDRAAEGLEEGQRVGVDWSAAVIGVEVEEFAPGGGLDAAHPQPGQVAREQADRLVGERVGLFPAVGLQAQRGLVAGPEIMAQPSPGTAKGLMSTPCSRSSLATRRAPQVGRSRRKARIRTPTASGTRFGVGLSGRRYSSAGAARASPTGVP